MQQGRVIKALNSFYFVQCGENLISCKLRGRFKKERITVCIGDMVEFDLLSGNNGVIEKLLPRKNLLYRPMVANIDQVIIVFAAKNPDPHPLLIDRFLVMSEWSKIPEIVLCCNKTDLIRNSEMENPLIPYRKIGYTVIGISAIEQIGTDEIKQRLNGKVTVFAGPSGVGKSSLLNSIDKSFNLQVGEISDKIKRGKHTTRLAQLIPFLDGAVVDTPGFSSLELTDIVPEALANYFKEFRPYLAGCYYRACTHSHEPDCVLKKALTDGKISEERYQSYLKLLKEILERKSERQW